MTAPTSPIVGRRPRSTTFGDTRPSSSKEGIEYRDNWEKGVGEILDEADLRIPDDPYQRSGGRRGFHSEHLGPLLAETQWMQRSHPGLAW